MATLARVCETQQFAHCREISKRVRWDIDRDVIRGWAFDFSKKYLPEAMSRVDEVDFLNSEEQRFLSQIQGWTYAGMFGFVESFVVAKILDISRRHWLRDQVALEALGPCCGEGLKHQELFRRIEGMIAQGLPPGCVFSTAPAG